MHPAKLTNHNEHVVTEGYNIICSYFLQKLHTLFNLSDVLSRHHPGCSNTLRDDKLPDEVRISYVFVVLLQINHCGCLQEWSLSPFSYFFR